MHTYRAIVYCCIKDYLRSNPNASFQDLFDHWTEEGLLFDGDMVREFARECGLLREFKGETEETNE